MDPATKEQFKWKFYRLAVLLNIIILLIAIGVVTLIKAPQEYRILAFALLIFVAIALAVYFRRNYQKTREWLEEHT